MLAETPHYDHRTHAGNAGDVWKHFILAEVADYLLSKRKILTYIESHVGYPRYNLCSSGELGWWNRQVLASYFCLRSFLLFSDHPGYES